MTTAELEAILLGEATPVRKSDEELYREIIAVSREAQHLHPMAKAVTSVVEVWRDSETPVETLHDAIRRIARAAFTP